MTRFPTAIACACGLAWALAMLPAMGALDVQALWDFGAPAESERRFREALERASGDEAIILKTQIARTYGLRADFDKARALLRELEPAIASAGAEARTRYWLELGRTYASGRHEPSLVDARARSSAREAYDKAVEISRAARLDGLTVERQRLVRFSIARCPILSVLPHSRSTAERRPWPSARVHGSSRAVRLPTAR